MCKPSPPGIAFNTSDSLYSEENYTIYLRIAVECRKGLGDITEFSVDAANWNAVQVLI